MGLDFWASRFDVGRGVLSAFNDAIHSECGILSLQINRFKMGPGWVWFKLDAIWLYININLIIDSFAIVKQVRFLQCICTCHVQSDVSRTTNFIFNWSIAVLWTNVCNRSLNLWRHLRFLIFRWVNVFVQNFSALLVTLTLELFFLNILGRQI